MGLNRPDFAGDYYSLVTRPGFVTVIELGSGLNLGTFEGFVTLTEMSRSSGNSPL